MRKLNTKKAYTRRRKGNKARKAHITKTVNGQKNMFLFKRYVPVSNLGLFNSSSSVGSLAATAGYLVATSSAAAATPAYFSFGMGFRLADVINVTEFTNLFDQYKICGIKIKILPVATVSETPFGSSGAMTYGNGGFIHTVVDGNDYTAPAASEAGIDVLRQYQFGYKVGNITKKCHSFWLRPKLSGDANVTTTPTAGLVTTGWLNSDTTTFAHYGFKGVLELMQPQAITTIYYYKCEIKFYMAFKDPR